MFDTKYEVRRTPYSQWRLVEVVFFGSADNKSCSRGRQKRRTLENTDCSSFYLFPWYASHPQVIDEKGDVQEHRMFLLANSFHDIPIMVSVPKLTRVSSYDFQSFIGK